MFDQDVAAYLALVGEIGQLENTIIVICSDNGWQMPRGLANLYDFGLRIPLIISWPGHFKEGRQVSDFVSLNDFAPTFLELVGMEAPGNYGPEYKEAFDSIYPDLAAEYGALYKESFFEGIMGEGDGPAEVQPYMQPDGIHPNAKGVAVIVEDFGPDVLELIDRIEAGAGS